MPAGLAWILAASLAGLGAMAAAATYLQPPTVGLQDVAQYVSQTVRVEGRILELRTYDSGWTRFLLADANHSVAATVEEAPEAAPGDWVRATGRVEALAGRIGIAIHRSEDVQILRPWMHDHVPLSRLAGAPWDYRDSHVATAGILERAGASQHLADPSGPSRIRASGPPLAVLSAGSLARVHAFLEYDASAVAFRLNVHAAQLADHGWDPGPS